MRDSMPDEVANLRERLASAEAALEALSAGQADAMLGSNGVISLRGAERPYQEFFEAMNEGGLTLDADGRVLHCNPRFSMMMGCPIDQIRGCRLVEFIAETDHVVVRNLLLCKVGGSVEVSLTPATATACPVLLSFRNIAINQQNFCCVVVTDLSAQRAAAIEALKARNLAEAASHAKSTFLANMSHEIRTPMNAILGFTHLLRRGETTRDQAEKLDKIASSAEHLLGVINDILDISKIEANKLILENSNFDIQGMVSRIATMVTESAQQKGLELIIDVDPKLGEVKGDALRLGQAVLNYLGNAVKFTQKGSITLRARVIEESHDEICVRFEVEDTGMGIRLEDQSKLFHAFEQADNSTTRRFGGSGLGLAITRRIAVLMGGEAGLNSKINVGSTFWLTARLGRVGANEARFVLPELAGKRVLVVDDMPVTRLLLVQMLHFIGLESYSVSDGLEALKLIQEVDQKGNPFDLVLIDLMMPNLNGIETLNSLRLIELQHQPLAWLVTASGNSVIHEDAIKAGFSEVLLKPISIQFLRDILQKNHGFLTGQATQSITHPCQNKADAEEILKCNYSNTRILLVDDEPINLEVTKAILEDIGCLVDCAENGREAIDLAASNSYHLILMDMQMPEMDGLEATRSIRQLTDYHDIPILALTANVFKEDRARCLEVGMSDFVCKPVAPELLFSTILNWLQRGTRGCN